MLGIQEIKCFPHKPIIYKITEKKSNIGIVFAA